jgi:hypothetical protein
VPFYGNNARVSLHASDSSAKALPSAIMRLPCGKCKKATKIEVRTWLCKNGLVGQRTGRNYCFRIVRLVRHVSMRHPSGTREGDFDNLVAPLAITEEAQ